MAAVQVIMVRRKATKRVLYVEAGKDFVDLLLSFLVLPVGSVVARLSGQSEVAAALGAITSISESAGKLGARHLKVAEGRLLHPKVSVHLREYVSASAGQLLGIQVASQPADVQTFYQCSRGCSKNMSTYSGSTFCSSCQSCTTTPFGIPEIVAVSGSGVVTDYPYIVTDGLEITPASADKCFDLLRSMNVLSMDDLESRSVEVGLHQALKLLAASFTSRTALSDVFGDLDDVEPGSGLDSVEV